MYSPSRQVCFFVRKPKLREVFAAEFRDRVVHHVLARPIDDYPDYIVDSTSGNQFPITDSP